MVMKLASGRNLVYFLKGEIYSYLQKIKFLLKGSLEPVNYRKLDSSPKALQRDVRYSFTGSNFYFGIFAGEFLKGKKVLEIGPGINFGLPLILACYGAEVVVADRFLPSWDPDYHPKFYALLRTTLSNVNCPLIDLTPLDKVLSQGGYPPESISLCSCSLEELSGIPDQSVDVVMSNAVLEHLYDLELAFSHLARITKPGGLGLHQVDFRDHLNFYRPLEHLLLGDEEFSQEFTAKHGELGNRYRPQEMRQLWELKGFEVKKFRPDILVDEAYFTEFLGRLRRARASRYHDYPADDLRFLSGLFYVLKKES